MPTAPRSRRRRTAYHGAGKSKTLIDRGQIAQHAANSDLTTALTAALTQLTE